RNNTSPRRQPWVRVVNENSPEGAAEMTLCAKPSGGRAYASRRRKVLIVDDHVRVAARARLLIEGVQRNPAITIARSDDSFGGNPLSIASDSPLDHSFETDVQPDDEFPE